MGHSTSSGNKSEWTHNSWKPIGHIEGSPEREFYSNTGLPKKDRNISNKDTNPICTRTGGTTTDQAQTKNMEGNNQDQSRIKWHRD